MTTIQLVTSTISFGTILGILYGIMFIFILETVILLRSVSKRTVIILLIIGFLFGLMTSYNLLTL